MWMCSDEEEEDAAAVGVLGAEASTKIGSGGSFEVAP